MDIAVLLQEAAGLRARSEELRAQARELRAEADALTDPTDRLWRRVAPLHWEGAVADGFRRSALSQRRRSLAASDELRQLAARLDGQAAVADASAQRLQDRTLVPERAQ